MLETLEWDLPDTDARAANVASDGPWRRSIRSPEVVWISRAIRSLSQFRDPGRQGWFALWDNQVWHDGYRHEHRGHCLQDEPRRQRLPGIARIRRRRRWPVT